MSIIPPPGTTPMGMLQFLGQSGAVDPGVLTAMETQQQTEDNGAIATAMITSTQSLQGAAGAAAAAQQNVQNQVNSQNRDAENNAAGVAVKETSGLGNTLFQNK